MGAINHQTIPVQVWVDVDVGIAECVRYLNTIPGVRTYASCQGCIGELSDEDKADGAEEYRAYVMVSWNDEETLRLLQADYDVDVQGEAWGKVHPRGNAQ